MRDPDRIDRILARLATCWKQHPDLRLAQIMANVGVSDMYYMEDNELIQALEKLFKELK